MSESHTKKPVYWVSPVPKQDDFGNPIGEVIIDGATRQGPWALMTEASHAVHGKGLGLGRGQKYVKTWEGNKYVWLKVEG